MKGAAATHNSNVATTVATTAASDILVAIKVSEGVSGCDDAAQGAVHHRCHLEEESREHVLRRFSATNHPIRVKYLFFCRTWKL